MAITKTTRPKKRVKPPPAPSRPPLKSGQINVRISDEQKALLVEAATKAGISMSSWMLMVALREARKVTGREG